MRFVIEIQPQNTLNSLGQPKFYQQSPSKDKLVSYLKFNASLSGPSSNTSRYKTHLRYEKHFVSDIFMHL